MLHGSDIYKAIKRLSRHSLYYASPHEEIEQKKINWRFIEGFSTCCLHVAIRTSLDGPCPKRSGGFYTQSGCAFRSRARTTTIFTPQYGCPSEIFFDCVLSAVISVCTYLRVYELAPSDLFILCLMLQGILYFFCKIQQHYTAELHFEILVATSTW